MLLKRNIRFYALGFLVFPLMAYAQNGLPGITDSTRTDVFMVDMLKQHPQYFDSILPGSPKFEVQAIYTKIDRGANGIAGLKHSYFNVNPSRGFNPASSIKLPLAMLTLQKLAALKTSGIDRNTTMLTEKTYSGQTAAYNDPTSPSGKPTIAQYIKRMLMVSDVAASNRLYEFLGQQYINQQLLSKEYTGAQITERLDADLTEDENRHTNAVKFFAPGNRLLYEQPAQFNTVAFSARKDTGTNNNLVPLENLHSMLISLVFPNKVTASQRFSISDDERMYLLKYMSQLPTESLNPPYSDEPEIYQPSHSKYLLCGAAKDSMPVAIRVFNVAGQSDGSMVDIAYIVDFDKKIEFFLSVVISWEEGEEGAGVLPLMNHWGEVFYEYDVKRERKIVPDLSEMKMNYDGR